MITQFTFLLLSNDCFNKEYYPDNNLKIYSSQILEKLITIYSKKEFSFEKYYQILSKKVIFLINLIINKSNFCFNLIFLIEVLNSLK